MWTAKSDGRLFTLILLATIAVAWVALITWGASPYGALLRHDAIGHTRLHLDVEYARTALLFVAGWTLMTVAMMLPTSLPLILLFRTITQRRTNRGELTALLIFGYLVMWTAFGVLAHFGDFWLHRFVESDGWLHANTWLLGAGPLLVAGVYQFTPLKYICLDKCRSPYSFIVEHWQGGNERLQALGLGLHHGLFCIGCCWSLMLLMFAVGTGSLVWMLALAIVMGTEKNMPWGRRLSTPMGVVLLTAGLTVFAMNAPGALS
jgi:predicted metal-binding membrane protein